MPVKKNPLGFFELFLISFLSLFLELSLIRWIPGTVSCMSYFTNLVLISAFLGLGLGCAISNQKPNLAMLPAFFLALFAFSIYLHGVGVSSWVGLADFIFLKEADTRFPMLLAIPAIFILIFILFIFIGVILGGCLAHFPPLVSYSINVLASIAGVAAFTFLSLRFAPPPVWFAIGFLGLIWFLRKRLIYAILCFSACLILSMLSSGDKEIWSPYYKLQISYPQEKENVFFELTVNNDYQQQAHNFGGKTPLRGYDKHWKDIYNLPYLFLRPEKVLIVGSGVGNDILLASENQVKTIDAVEIDAGIVDIGRRLRPDDPYGGKNVKVFVDDARSFLNKTKAKYQLIVYGFLDSHALFANMASVRLDNFVYTVEGLRQARKLLAEEGVVSLSFYVGKEWVGNKIYYILKEVFGHPPLVYASRMIPTEQIFIISRNKDIPKGEFSGFNEVSDKYELSKKLPLPTDDWPYFYLKEKTIPPQYLAILAIIFVMTLTIMLLLMPRGKGLPNHSPFFFLGAAFMLIETKGIVQLSLIFGTTWVVNAVVICAILLMTLLANLYCLKFNPKATGGFYVWLLVIICLSWLFKPYGLPAVLLVTAPLFFSGVIFASLFKTVKDAAPAFGANLLGAALGGFLEYLSLLVGLNNLAFLVFGLYLLSFLSWRMTPRANHL